MPSSHLRSSGSQGGFSATRFHDQNLHNLFVHGPFVCNAYKTAYFFCRKLYEANLMSDFKYIRDERSQLTQVARESREEPYNIVLEYRL